MATDVSSNKESEARGSAETLYEVVDGTIVELPAMGTPQELTAGILHLRLGSYVDTAKSGRVVVETLFDFVAQIRRKRRPDVAYVSSQRWPRPQPVPDQDGWTVVPELAVEVISPSNTWNEITDKIHEYFEVGVQRVWVVSTAKKQVHIYSSPTSIEILSHNQDLADEELFPGFKLPLADLFEVVA